LRIILKNCPSSLANDNSSPIKTEQEKTQKKLITGFISIEELS